MGRDLLEEMPGKGTGKGAREGQGEPGDCDAGLSSVKERGKEGGWAGRVPNCSAVPPKSWPTQWDVLKPESSIRDKEGPALVPRCALSLAKRSLWEVRLQREMLVDPGQ